MGKVGKLAGLLVCIGIGDFSLGQTPVDKAAPTDTKSPAHLGAIFKEWTKARRAVTDSHYSFTWTFTGDPLWVEEKQVVYHGEVFLHWPDKLRIENKDAKGRLNLIALFTGDRARIYSFNERKEWLISLPDGQSFPSSADHCTGRDGRCLSKGILETMLWPILGPPTEGLDKRFVSRLEKQDDYWTYIILEPKYPEGWLPDEEWRVVLNRKDHWLRQVMRKQVKVNFGRPDHTALPPSTWNLPFRELPQGWQCTEYPADSK